MKKLLLATAMIALAAAAPAHADDYTFTFTSGGAYGGTDAGDFSGTLTVQAGVVTAIDRQRQRDRHDHRALGTSKLWQQ